MMETFIVLGLCFILYEALDFFQGCIHSAQPRTSEQIASFRRHLDEQQQQQLQQHQQQQQQLEDLKSSTTSSIEISTNSIDNNYHQSALVDNCHTNSTNNQSSAIIHTYNNRNSRTTSTNYSSLPRDYNNCTNKSSKLISKLSSSDNRIYPQFSTASSFDIIPPSSPAIVSDLRRVIFSEKHNHYQHQQREDSNSNVVNNDPYNSLTSSNEDDDDDEFSDNEECVRIFSISENI